jgi:LysM repeat protein
MLFSFKDSYLVVFLKRVIIMGNFFSCIVSSSLMFLVCSTNLIAQISFADSSDSLDNIKTPEIYKFRFYKIDRDTISLDINDILVSDSFCAQGIPYTYDALHSFNARRMDRFGGYLNVKINKGLEELRNKGFQSDIKKLYIQINPVSLKVYWVAILGPSMDGLSYVRVDSRGSAGGGLTAVEKQLPRMHRIYDGLSSHKFLEFNEDVRVFYDWNGNQLCDFQGTIKIIQHFYKYGTSDPARIPSVLENLPNKLDSLSQSPSITTPKSKTTAVSKPKLKMYKVRAGDSLSEIAEKYHVSLSQLKKTNSLRSNTLQIGQTLKIPN